jgi:hypothetical protein
MASFRADFEGESPSLQIQTKLSEGERLLGVYENTPLSSFESIFVTDKGLCFEENGIWLRVDYSEINSVDLPLPENIDRSNSLITIIKKDGSKTQVPIRGGRERFFDLYEFGRFLMRVAEDSKRVS